jgi:hypothetical protein
VTGDLAKKIVRMIKDSKIKVRPASRAMRCASGTKRDDLQAVIAMLRKDANEAPSTSTTSATERVAAATTQLAGCLLRYWGYFG